MGVLRLFKCDRAILVILVGVVSIYNFDGANSEGTPSLNWQFDPFWTADQWFKQKLDHYDSSNVQYWPQRYITSYRFYRLGGPIFLLLSGPGPELALSDIESGAIAEYAEEQGAFVIGLEHRFYGKSRPTEDLSTKNLQFLTVPQTLEDIAAFVRQWRSRDEFKHSKWVVFGASYLGSVATWFAQKHPELVDAFVASSPPLELRYEIPEFLENVGNVLNRTDPKCYDVISDSFTCLQKVFNEQGCQNYTLDDVKSKFNFCAELDPSRPLDASGAIAELFSTVNAVVMYHDPGPESFPDANLDRFCRHLTREDGTPSLEKLGEKVKEINKHRKIPCAEFRFETTVQFLDEKEWSSDAAKEGYRQLQWQLCNELGWTVASANISQPFGNYLSPFLHAEICQKLFDLSETEMRLKVLQSNTDLHGKNIATQCGIFVNGDMDPWHAYSITTDEEAGKCNRALLIEGGSHGRDIEDFSREPSYPPTVRETQIKIARYLDYFLKTGKCCDEDPQYIRNPINPLLRMPSRSRPRPVRRSASASVNMNVRINPRGEPKYIASPTAIPRMVSTTDVLSVSPRIPVASKENSDMYRDPNNAEMRRYRVVKLLRHRPSYMPPEMIPESSPAPSMEQFEAEFPEHSLRVEGRVERVYKNGTKVQDEDDKRWDQFQRGRKHLLREDNPPPNYAVSPTAKPLMGKEEEDDEEEGRKHFRYVVKQVFKDVVTSSPKTTSKRQGSLEVDDVETIRNMNGPMSVSYEPPEATIEEDDGAIVRKRESGEVKEKQKPVPRKPEISVKVTTTKSSTSQKTSKSSSRKGRQDEEEDDEYDDGDDEDYYDDGDYDDDDEYSDEDDDDEGSSHANEDARHRPIKSTRSKTISETPKKLNNNASSTEFTSGEDTKPRRLREKISEKIMSSSENLEGDQKSKEKSKSKARNQHESEDDDSDEDNFSLEPSGSNPQGHFKKSSSKKQLEPIVKSEPSTVINVEISGSYPKSHGHNLRRKKKKSKTTTTTTTTEAPEIEEITTTTTTTTKKPKRRVIVRRRKHKTTPTTTTTTEPTTTTTEATTSTTSEVPATNNYATWNRERPNNNLESKPIQQAPPTVVDLNPGPGSGSFPVGEESSAPPPNPPNPPRNDPNNNSNDVMYIIIGDIPLEQNEVDDGPPSTDALFRFIQKLVNRHSAGGAGGGGLQRKAILSPSPRPEPLPLPIPQESYTTSVPSPPPTTTQMPPSTSTLPPFYFPEPQVQINPRGSGNLGFDEHTGKFILVRPVQVIPLGRERVVRPHDLRNETFLNHLTMEAQGPPPPATPLQSYSYQVGPAPPVNERGSGYEFKSPFHRNNFEKLLSVDEQVRDSDRPSNGNSRHRNNYIDRRLDYLPDPSWRSIRGISQFGPAIPPSAQGGGATSGLLSLSAADTQWVNDGIPFLPSRGGRGLFRRNVK